MIARYFEALSETMARESRLLGEVYRHPGKLGENREALVARFLETYLPRRHGVASGFALFGSELSTQQDVVVYDALDNPVLFPGASAPLFPPSGLEALVEVKSTLDRRELAASVKKAAKFKGLLRESFADHPEPPELEALSMLFAFEARLDLPEMLAEVRALEEEDGTEMRDRLDLICVLGRGVMLGGSLMYQTAVGSPLTADAAAPRQQRVAVAVENALFVFYARLLDYLGARPVVRPQVMSYLPPETPMGVTVAVG